MYKYWVIILFFAFAGKSAAQQKAVFDSLNSVLEKVYDDDQKPRIALDSLEKQLGYNSPQVQEQWQIIHKNDAKNVSIVIPVLNRFGWPGTNMVSEKANNALFYVIQHADLEIQLKYINHMQKAVYVGKAKEADFAYLQDRIYMKQGKFQYYGTQLLVSANGYTYLYPIADEAHVNERRVLAGLKPIENIKKNDDFAYNISVKNTSDSLVAIIGFVNDMQGSPLKHVSVYLNDEKITFTDTGGFYKFLLAKPLSNKILRFEKENHETVKIFLSDENKEVYQYFIGMKNIKTTK
jgi:hypothetical protein